MSTFLQMKNRIADDVSDTTIATTIGTAINRAQEHYESYRFFFNETNGTFPTVSGQESYGTADSVPATIAEIDVVTLTATSSNIYTLIQTSFEAIRQMNVGGSTATGYPTYYAYFQEKFWFHPVPNGAYTVTVYFKKTYTQLSADGDTNDWTEEAEDLIEARARWWIWKRIKRNHEEAGEAKLEEIEALKALESKSTMLLSSGSVRKSYL